MQTKRQSIIESIVQQVVGYTVGLGTQFLVFPLFNMEVNLVDNLLIGVIFAIVGTIRSYSLRRVFNKQHATDTRDADLVQVLHASNLQKDELILEVQEYNIGLQVEARELSELVSEMSKYIKKIDGVY